MKLNKIYPFADFVFFQSESQTLGYKVAFGMFFTMLV